MDAADPHFLYSGSRFDLDFPICGKRLVVLRDLVPLWQIGIKIILARKNTFHMDFAIECQPDANRQLNCFLIQYGKRARLARTNWTDVTIRSCGDGIDNFTATKHFRLCEQLCVDFKSDDRFVFHVCSDSLSPWERVRVREKLIIPAWRVFCMPIRLALIHVTDT